MKRLLIAMMMMLGSAGLFAEEADSGEEMETLFGTENLKFGGYGAPELKMGIIGENDLAIIIGGRGGVIFNNSVSFGGASYTLITAPNVDYNEDLPQGVDDLYLRANWGGFYLEYISSSEKSVHFVVSSMIGWGEASYTPSFSDMVNKDLDWTWEKSNMFVFEPGIGLELNLTKYMRLELGASYRIVSGLELSQTENTDLSGFSGNLALKFGLFEPIELPSSIKNILD